MKYIIGVVIFLATIIGSVFLIGFFLPVEHTASVSISINAPKEAVWDKISKPQNFPEWRKNVSSVEILSDSSVPLIWKEVYTNGEFLRFKEISSNDSSLFVSEIIDDGLPFGGLWTIRLEEVAESTSVSITEKGKVYSALFRFFSKFVFGHESTMREYLGYLEDSF